MNYERANRTGKFIVIDGLDGIGKGLIEKALVDFEISRGKRIFDSVNYSLEMGIIPSFEEINSKFDVILTAEPTRSGIGKIIREEMVAKNDRHYSFDSHIQAYSLDRLVQMKRIVIPCLMSGKTVIQSRSVASTLCYQSLEAKNYGNSVEEIRNIILNHEGNKLQLEYSPDLLIIPTIKNVEKLFERLKKRVSIKNDNCIFENLDFQSKLKLFYEEEWLKNLFESKGSKVRYLDADISEEETRRQAVKIYREFLKI